MSTAAERADQLDLVARLKSAYPELPDAPSPDLLDHDRFTAYMKPVHDVGGEPDAPIKYENKDYEYWEHMTYVMCEVLAWRGIWLSEERRRMGNVDVGRAVYLGFPYYGRWLLSVARVLVEKHHIGLTELAERMAEVQQRYAGGLAGKALTAEPRFAGDGSQVDLYRLWMRRHTTKFNGVSYIVQRGAEAVYTPAGKQQTRGLIEGYLANAKLIRDGLSKLGMKTFGGVNAPYVWVETPGGAKSWDHFDMLLSKAHVVCTPGSGFGQSGEGYVRLSAFNSRANVEEALGRIAKL